MWVFVREGVFAFCDHWTKGLHPSSLYLSRRYVRDNIHHLLRHRKIWAVASSQLDRMHRPPLRPHAFHHGPLVIQRHRHILARIDVRHGNFPPRTVLHSLVHRPPVPAHQRRHVRLRLGVIDARADQQGSRIAVHAAVVGREVKGQRQEVLVAELLDLADHGAALGQGECAYVDEMRYAARQAFRALGAVVQA